LSKYGKSTFKLYEFLAEVEPEAAQYITISTLNNLNVKLEDARNLVKEGFLTEGVLVFTPPDFEESFCTNGSVNDDFFEDEYGTEPAWPASSVKVYPYFSRKLKKA